MPNVHLYLFSDACGTDWLQDGHDDDWHTIANVLVQSDPSLQQEVDQGRSHEDVPPRDPHFTALLAGLQACLPAGRLRKWDSTPRYQTNLTAAFTALPPTVRPIVSACSFQEKVLRAAKPAVLAAYNGHIGGVEGRGIGFEEFTDRKGRRRMRHQFLNFHGHHKIEAPENQMLVLLLMAWFAADQYAFHLGALARGGWYGFDGLGLTVVSDKLSGDDDARRASEFRLRCLIDPEGGGGPIALTRSVASDTFPGDLLADNLAGWLNAAMRDPSGEAAEAARRLADTGALGGWHQLVPDPSTLRGTSAVTRLGRARPPG